MAKTGFFISFEGIDGCGKSTQARELAQWLEELGYEVVLTREPGGTGLGERLRELVLHPDSKIGAEAELFIYLADRAQHVQEVIQPALSEGKIVISERFADSTIAYQGAGRGLPRKRLEMLNKVATGGLQPDLTILLDISPAAARKRRTSNGLKDDRFERLERSFHERLAEEYRKLAAEEPLRIAMIKATGKAEQVQQRIQRMLAACYPALFGESE